MELTIDLELYKAEGYNNPSTNERTIELPLAKLFLDRFEDVIEIGAVTPYYWELRHRVIDLFDKHPRAENTDATTLSFEGQNILSISTIEHMGLNDYGGVSKTNMAFEFLQRIIAEAQNYMITIPAGYNKVLDQQVRELPKVTFKRVNQANDWIETDELEFQYGRPFQNANGLYVFSNMLCCSYQRVIGPFLATRDF